MNWSKIINYVKWVFVIFAIICLSIIIYQKKYISSSTAEYYQDDNAWYISYIASDSAWIYDLVNTEITWWYVSIKPWSNIWSFAISQNRPISSPSWKEI